MTCTAYDDLLDDYVDGVRAGHHPPDQTERMAAFEEHLAACARCRSLVADFGRLREAVSGLEDHAPPARVWARIAADLEGRRAVWAVRPLAAAALVALVVGSAVWFDKGPAVSPSPVDDAGEPAAVTTAERDYEEAIANLQRAIASEDLRLDSATNSVLRENLAVLDRAITESRAALMTEPTSALAQETLLDALDSKVALLQDTVALAGEIEATTGDDVPGSAREINQ